MFVELYTILDMQKRNYGSTGIKLSVIGFGGILVMDENTKIAEQIVSEAIERGINYFDVAPSYGNAEDRLGPALEKYRKNVFLACKTEERTGGKARSSLEASLKKMRTDYFDLFQLHAMTSDEDVQVALRPDGAVQALVKAREEGLIRYIGFSAHSESAALALLDAFPFDSILFPINEASYRLTAFGDSIINKARGKQVPILALKALAKRALSKDENRIREKAWYAPVESYEEAERGLRFSLSQDGVVAAVSPGHLDLFRWACDAADRLEQEPALSASSMQEGILQGSPLFPLS
ncbi:aldo/keto reductase [Treponema sp.]